MAYTDATKIKSMFRDFATPTNTAVTDAEIDEFIDEITAIIDAKLTGYYTLPISGAATQSLLILERINRLLVAGQVDEILNSYGEADKKPSFMKNGMDLLKSITPKFNSTNKQWESPELTLPDSAIIGVPSNPAKATIKVSSTATPTFSKGVDAW